MARKRVSPEAQIIALFTGLSEESKRMVMFGLNAISSIENPKSPAPGAAKKSSTKGAAAPTIPESAKCKAEGCGELAGHPNHDKAYLSSHEFQSAPVSKKKVKVETVKEPEVSSAAVAGA